VIEAGKSHKFSIPEDEVYYRSADRRAEGLPELAAETRPAPGRSASKLLKKRLQAMGFENENCDS
jgi:hypothetical protein